MRERLSDARGLATRIVTGQASVTLLLAVIASVIGGAQAGWSAALGGGIGTSATLYMATRALGRDESDGPAMLRRFLRAEVLKIGLTVALFILAFRFVPVAPLWMLGAYAATYAAYAAALFGDASGPPA